jgi:hypothetical protein
VISFLKEKNDRLNMKNYFSKLSSLFHKLSQ